MTDLPFGRYVNDEGGSMGHIWDTALRAACGFCRGMENAHAAFGVN